MLHVEFHCHTIYSKDSLLPVEKLLATCQHKGIDRVVITDHNQTEGAFRAREIDSQRVIVGEEIMTSAGELLAAFVEEKIPPGLPPLEAIARLRDQGAFISVSHPFDVMRKGHWELSDLEQIVPLVDAIETFNARCFSAEHNHQAQEFAQDKDILGTAGSDAHAAFELGKAQMILPEFHDADSLRLALAQVQFQVSMSAPWVHFISRYATLRKKLGLWMPAYLPD